MEETSRCGQLIQPGLWVAGLLAIVAYLIPTPAGAVPLTSWNVAEINASGDFVDVTIGTWDSGTKTLFTAQWKPGPSNVLAPEGLDKFYYNDDTTIQTVWRGSMLAANDVTSDWNLNFNGNQADGFGAFLSRTSHDSSGTDGISAATKLLFGLSGLITPTPPSPNATPNEASFAAHVRYDNECSGWASDGTVSPGSLVSDPNCARVPEPASLLLLGSGLAGLGLWQWRRRRD